MSLWTQRSGLWFHSPTPLPTSEVHSMAGRVHPAEGGAPRFIPSHISVTYAVSVHHAQPQSNKNDNVWAEKQMDGQIGGIKTEDRQIKEKSG